MVNHFEVDRKREHQSMIQRIIMESDPEKGGGTHRYRFSGHGTGGHMVKVPASEDRSMRVDIVERNVEILSELGISFPDTVAGVYDLAKQGYWHSTPTVMQELVDATFRDTLNGKRPTEDTEMLLEAAVKAVDRAYEAGIELDCSMSNFGFKGDIPVFIDFQDAKSIVEGGSDLNEMYKSLRSSFGQLDVDRKKVDRIISKNSEILSGKKI